MQYPVKVVYDDGHSIQEGYFYLNGAEMTGLTIVSQNPWEIDAIWSDGSYTDVTDLCTFTYNGNTVLIEYNGFFITGELAIESTDPLSVFMEYSDGSEFDVTEDCQITYDGDEIIVEYEELVVSGAWLIVSNLQITTPPTKTSYIANEEIDYSGIVVKYVHSDGSEHDVTKYCDFDPASGTVITQTTYATISCAPPLEPYVYDQNSGYINNGIWQVELPTSTYIDIYQVQAGHKYWLTLGAKVGSRFRAMFTTIDISQASSNVTGTSIINANNPATYASVTYTPSSNGYIAVAKDNAGVSGLYTYLFDTSATNKTERVMLPLIVGTLSSIEVTNMPTKTLYNSGEAIDYSGIKIKAIYIDVEGKETVKEIDTANTIFSLPEDSIVTIDTPETILVSYTDNEITVSTTFSITLHIIKELIITPPTKTSYIIGEALDYTGLNVIGKYTDNVQQDITSLVSCDFPHGTRVRHSTYYSLQPTPNIITISYIEGVDSASNTFLIDIEIPRQVDFTFYTQTSNGNKRAVSLPNINPQTFEYQEAYNCAFILSDLFFNPYYEFKMVLYGATRTVTETIIASSPENKQYPSKIEPNCTLKLIFSNATFTYTHVLPCYEPGDSSYYYYSSMGYKCVLSSDYMTMLTQIQTWISILIRCGYIFSTPPNVSTASEIEAQYQIRLTNRSYTSLVTWIKHEGDDYFDWTEEEEWIYDE